MWNKMLAFISLKSEKKHRLLKVSLEKVLQHVFDFSWSSCDFQVFGCESFLTNQAFLKHWGMHLSAVSYRSKIGFLCCWLREKESLQKCLTLVVRTFQLVHQVSASMQSICFEINRKGLDLMIVLQLWFT